MKKPTTHRENRHEFEPILPSSGLRCSYAALSFELRDGRLNWSVLPSPEILGQTEPVFVLSVDCPADHPGSTWINAAHADDGSHVTSAPRFGQPN